MLSPEGKTRHTQKEELNHKKLNRQITAAADTGNMEHLLWVPRGMCAPPTPPGLFRGSRSRDFPLLISFIAQGWDLHHRLILFKRDEVTQLRRRIGLLVDSSRTHFCRSGVREKSFRHSSGPVVSAFSRRSAGCARMVCLCVCACVCRSVSLSIGVTSLVDGSEADGRSTLAASAQLPRRLAPSSTAPLASLRSAMAMDAGGVRDDR